MKDNKIPRVLMLDMDGPMIPGGMYFVNKRCSWERICSPMSVAIVNRLLDTAGAKLVMNTYHNTAGDQLKTDLIREGIKEEHFHEDWQTLYPHGIHGIGFGKTEHRENPYDETDISDRLAAIHAWLEKNGEADWLCFDDSDFTKNPRLIVTDFDTGITPAHFNKAARFWGCKPFLIL